MCWIRLGFKAEHSNIDLSDDEKICGKCGTSFNDNSEEADACDPCARPHYMDRLNVLPHPDEPFRVCSRWLNRSDETRSLEGRRRPRERQSGHDGWGGGASL